MSKAGGKKPEKKPKTHKSGEPLKPCAIWKMLENPTPLTSAMLFLIEDIASSIMDDERSSVDRALQVVVALDLLVLAATKSRLFRTPEERLEAAASLSLRLSE